MEKIKITIILVNNWINRPALVYIESVGADACSTLFNSLLTNLFAMDEVIE